MDGNKRKALIEWINALVPGHDVKSVLDLDDGKVFIQLLELCDELLVPEVPGNTQDRFTLIKQYLEGFYSIELGSTGHLLDFSCITRKDISKKDKEWNLAKILFALLEACVLEKKNDCFVQTATALSESVQMEIMQMLQPMIISFQDGGNHLMDDFAGILTKSSDTNAHQDAALFFQLVTQSNMSRVTSTPNVEHSFNFSRFSNHVSSPVSHNPLNVSLGTSLHEIASPLRMLTIANSPVTPLGALMQSPQLAQKALIRQREREIKKLELSLQNERHLRTELEFDIHEKTELLNDRESKIKEYEKVVRQQRNIHDMMDEIDSLKQEKERNQKDMTRLQQKMDELQTIKENCSLLENENKQLTEEFTKMKTEIQTMENLKKSHEEYRTQSHLQSLKLSDMETHIRQKDGELEFTNQELTNSEEKRRNLMSQIDSLKKSKEEMEELLTCSGGGESMGVISEKRIKELEDELLQVKSSMMEKSQYEILNQQMLVMTETKDTLETKLSDLHKRYIERDGEANQLVLDVSKMKSNNTILQDSNDEMVKQIKQLQQDVEELKQSEVRLTSAEELATSAKKNAEDEVINLNKEVLRLKAEIQFTVQDLESTKLTSENRRQTMAATHDMTLTEKKTMEQRLQKANQKLEEQVSELKIKIQTQKEEAGKIEESLKCKIQTLQTSLKQTEIMLENEKWTKDSTVEVLKEELRELQQESNQMEKSLQNDVTKLMETKSDLELQLTEQKESYVQQIDCMTEQISEYKSAARQNESDLCDKIQVVRDENMTLKNELEILKTTSQKSNSNWEQKYGKLETKAKEQEKCLQKEINALQDKHQWSLHDNQSLTDEIADYKESHKEKSTEIDNLKSQIISQKQVESDFKCQLSELTNSKQILLQQIEDLQKDLLSEQNNHAAIVSKITEEHEQEVQKLKDSLSAQEASSIDTRQNLETCINELQTSLEKEIEKAKEADNSSCAQITHLEKELSELQVKYENDSSSYKSSVTALNNELEQLRMQTAVSEEMLNKDLKICRTELDKVNKEYSELNNKYKSVTENERSLDSRLNELHQQISELEKQKKDCENHIDQHKEKIDDLTGQVVLIKKVAESKQADNDKLCTENKNLSVKLEDISEKLLKECGENDAMRHKGKDLQKHINSLQSELSDTQLKLKENVKLLEEKSSSLEQEIQKVSSRNEEVSNLNQELLQSRDELSLLEQQISLLTQEKGKLDEKVNSLTSAIEDTQNSYSVKESMLNEQIQTLSDSCKKEVSELEKSEAVKAELKSEIDKVKSDLFSSNTEIHKLVQENKDLKSSLDVFKDDHSQEIQSLTHDKEVVMTDYEQKLSEISEKFSSTKSALMESHNEKLNSLNEEILSSKNHYEKSIMELKQRLESEKDTLEKQFQHQIEELKKALVENEDKMLTLQKGCETKNSDTEKYWQSQLQQLEIEYSQASDEQKEEYHQQVQEQEMRFQSQFEALVQEKEMILSSQKVTFQERVKQLETRITQKQTELQKITTEMHDDQEKIETDYKQKLANIESILKKEMADQKDLMKELKQNKERVSELQTALRDKRTNYESSLDSVREEYTSQMSQLEREKNRQIEDEKQRRQTLEESCHCLNQRIETSLAENNSLKQQLAAVEEEKNQLILEYERTLDAKKNNFEDQEILKRKIEMLKSNMQKLDVEAKFHKEQLASKVQEMKEEMEYKEKLWSEEMESYKKQYTEANQQKIHLQEQSRPIKEDNEQKEKIIVQYKKYYAHKKEANLLLQQEVAAMKKVADSHKRKVEAREAELESVKTNYKTKSEKLENQLELLKETVEEQKSKFTKSETEVAPVKLQLQEEINKNKTLQNKVKTLEVQLDYADKQVREFRHKLEEADRAFLGDNADFLKLKKDSDVSLMETSLQEDTPLTPYGLRSKSRKNSLDRSTSQSSIEHQCKSDGDEKNLSPMSLRSHGRRTSLSDPNLNATIGSIDSLRSTTSRGMKRFVNDEDDEGEVLEWKRLGELSRRNTLCLPHLKTSYPVETQKIQLRVFPETSLQKSSINPNSMKKRKQEILEEDEVKTEFYDNSKHKHAKHGTVYQKPGPPTPGNTNRRNSRGALHSPRSPLHSTGRKRTPKRTPKKTPIKPEFTNENIKPSTTFSVGFTPKNKRLTRQQGFVTSGSKSTTKGHKHRQPLAVKNCFQQTGV